MRLTRRDILGSAVAVAGLAALPVRASERLSVVATTGMIADAARVVGGDVVDVRALMGPGVDPHAYRQTRSDIVAMTRAGLVLWHGLYLEAQMEEFFEDLSRNRNVVAVGTSVPEDKLVSHETYAGRFDPHVWMDPLLWTHVIEGVRDALSETLPDEAEGFAERAAAYVAQAEALGAYAAKVSATVPETARVLVTAHDAFGYFGSAYGFQVEGIQGISTESEAGLNRMSELVDMLVTQEIGAVFVESSVSDRNIRALIEGAKAKGHEVQVGGELYSDAMGREGTYEGTWLGMIDHNVTTIVGALGGDVPVRGMSGKLKAGS